LISIKKIDSGKILREVFTDTVDLVADGWNLHPSVDRYMITNGNLQISHGDSPAYLLRDLPTDAVMEMQNIYSPSTASDTGGFIAYAQDDDCLQLYEYFNDQVPVSLSYPWVRLVRTGGLQYAGYGSQDGLNWDIRGAIQFEDANKWGVALEGIDGDPLLIQSLTIYKSTTVNFQAVPQGGKVEIYDGDLLVSDAPEAGYAANVSVFMKTIPFNGTIKVYDNTGAVVSQGDFEIYGGDSYHCGQFLEVLYNGVPLDLMNNDFGYIDSFYKDFKLEIKNLISADHTNVNLSIQKYYSEFGYEWVDVCMDNNGAPDGNFSKQLLFDTVPADGSVFFWVRIMRNSVPVTVDDYIFDFVINIW
jgi:hypothetical protein